jgi:hypothetical protein
MTTLTKLFEYDPGFREGVEWRFNCPSIECRTKPKDAEHRSLVVNSETGAWTCHRCGAHGYLKNDHAPEIQAVAQVSSPNAKDWKKYVIGVKDFPFSVAEIYLMSRGIPSSISRQSWIKFHPAWYGSGPAVLFVVCDASKAVVAVHGRYLRPDASPRMKSAGPVSQGVFQTPDALSNPVLIICEAPIDALSLAVCGLPAIATCGAGNIPDWLPDLAKTKKKVLIAFDHDEGGNKGANKLSTALKSVGVHPYRLYPKTGEDWNDYLQNNGAVIMKDLIEDAISQSDNNHASSEIKIAEVRKL